MNRKNNKLRNDKLKELEDTLSDLNSTESGRRVFLQALPFLLASCASGEKTRYREGDNSGQATNLSVTDERRMTNEVLPKMKQDYPAIRNQQLQNYVRKMGRDIVSKNNYEGNPYYYNFTVVDVPYVNAFALPAGTVFVTAPLIEMADSEAELAGVIGHEVGHITARHTAERMFKAEKKSGGILFGAAGGLIGGLLGYGVGKISCPPKDQKCLQKAALIGAGAGVAGGLLIKKYGFMQNSREDEMEADRLGFKTSVKAGYHKDHVGRFYSKLLQMEQQGGEGSDLISGFLSDAMSTHPPSISRVQQMNEMASQSQVGFDGKVSGTGFRQVKSIAGQYASRARARAAQEQKQEQK